MADHPPPPPARPVVRLTPLLSSASVNVKVLKGAQAPPKAAATPQIALGSSPVAVLDARAALGDSPAQSPAQSLVFSLDGFESDADASPPDSPRYNSAPGADAGPAALVARLFKPASGEEDVLAAHAAGLAAATGGSLPALAGALRRLGYAVTVFGSTPHPDAPFATLRHAFLSVRLASGTELSVDPGFRDVFEVQRATPRYAAALAAVPAVAVAPRARLLRAAALLSAELADAFAERSVAPWRRGEAAASRWRDARALALHEEEAEQAAAPARPAPQRATLAGRFDQRVCCGSERLCLRPRLRRRADGARGLTPSCSSPCQPACPAPGARVNRHVLLSERGWWTGSPRRRRRQLTTNIPRAARVAAAKTGRTATPLQSPGQRAGPGGAPLISPVG
jgi:uncharacterized protein (TIGR01615 family)